LPSDRFELLDSLGLEWESDFDHEERWEEYLDACKEFLTIEGRTPTTGDEFYIEPIDGIFAPPGAPSLQQITEGKTLKIGNWLAHQRRFYKQGKMRPDRIKKMEEVLEIIWEPTKNKWDKKFAVYKDYVETTGEQPQRRTKHQGIAIGNWISNTVRSQKSKLTPEWVQCFDELGMIWKKRKPTERTTEKTHLPIPVLWHWKYKVYKDYIEKTGQQPPTEFTRHKDIAIGSWLYKEVIPNKDRLSEEQINKLEAMGINWESTKKEFHQPSKEKSFSKSRPPLAISITEKDWDIYYAFCRTYLSDFFKLPSSEVIFQDMPIGKWFDKQRKDWKAGLLDLKQSSRMQSLQEIATLLSSREKETQSSPANDWIFSYVLCKEYLKKFNELPFPETMYEDQPIGKWIEKQIEDSKSGQLSSQDFSRLETLLQISEIISDKK